VAPEDQPRIFEKFFRVARSTPSQNGTGLGLSISKGLIEAMGGAITARNRTDGSSGLEVIVRMPSEPALV
jgi:two-component system sensor histidine kinase KdpD